LNVHHFSDSHIEYRMSYVEPEDIKMYDYFLLNHQDDFYVDRSDEKYIYDNFEMIDLHLYDDGQPDQDGVNSPNEFCFETDPEYHFEDCFYINYNDLLEIYITFHFVIALNILKKIMIHNVFVIPF